MRKTLRGWIQIGDSRATSQRDSPIWIHPLGVFRYRRNRKYYPRPNKVCVPKIPKFKHNTFGGRPFAVCGLMAWNCLPKDIRLCDEYGTFKWCLTHWGREKKWTPFRRRHFQVHFLDENVLFTIKISLKFVPNGQINKIPAMVQIMAWRRPGDKPLSEPMVVSLPTHICVIRPQWVKDSSFHQIREWAYTCDVIRFIEELLKTFSTQFVAQHKPCKPEHQPIPQSKCDPVCITVRWMVGWDTV